MDKAHRQTDLIADDVEKKIKRIYRNAYKEVEKVTNKFFSKYEDKDKAMAEKVKNEQITEQDYITWRKNTIFSGEDYKKMVDDVNELLINASIEAQSLVNDNITDVWALNSNFIAEQLNKEIEGI